MKGALWQVPSSETDNLNMCKQTLEDKGVRLNICAANKHLPEIERYIRTVEEGVHENAMTLIIKMVYNFVFWLNSIPHHERVQATMSSRTIMKGQRLLDDKHCELECANTQKTQLFYRTL